MKNHQNKKMRLIIDEMMKYKLGDFSLINQKENHTYLVGGGGKQYKQISNFWDEDIKDIVVVGAGPIGLWCSILLLKFNRARNVFILEKRLDNDMWNKRKYVFKINNIYLRQIDDLFEELNQNIKNHNKKKDDYSIKNLSFEKILKIYTEINPFINQYEEVNPNPSDLNYDQDFYAISNFQNLLKEHLDKNYSNRFKILAFSDKMINYDKETNKINLNLAEINKLCEADKNITIGNIIDCSGGISFIMNKTLGIKFNNKKATNYGVGIKINWNKSNIQKIYEEQQNLIIKYKKKKINKSKKYKYYIINKANISNIEFEDLHFPSDILNAKVLFAECSHEQEKLLTDAKYNINTDIRKSYLPFKKSVLNVDSIHKLLCNKEKYTDDIGYFQRDALRLFWKECVNIYNDHNGNQELKNNILIFFTQMKKNGMSGMNAYDLFLYLRNINTFGSVAVICYILNHLFYCRFIPEINKNEDITNATDIYVIDNNGKNIKNLILNNLYHDMEKLDRIQILFIHALKEINVIFIPERTEQILNNNLVNISTVETNIYQLKIDDNKDNIVNKKCNTYLSNNVNVFAIGDALFTTDFSLGMGINRGLSEALQIIRDGISPQRIRNEMNKYIHPKNLPKTIHHKLLYNLNSNYYFIIESIIPHAMIQQNHKKKTIFKHRKHRLRWRKKYMKYIISLFKK